MNKYIILIAPFLEYDFDTTLLAHEVISANNMEEAEERAWEICEDHGLSLDFVQYGFSGISNKINYFSIYEIGKEYKKIEASTIMNKRYKIYKAKTEKEGKEKKDRKEYARLKRKYEGNI